MHTYYPGDDEDENEGEAIWRTQKQVEQWGGAQQEALFRTDYCNGNNEVSKIFNRKCIIGFERDSESAFRKCSHQGICEKCFNINGDIIFLKHIICTSY